MFPSNQQPPQVRSVTGFAVAALALGLLSGCSTTVHSVSSPSSGEPSHSVSVSNLQVGQCVDGVQNDQSNSRVTVTGCSNPHDAEVLYTYQMTDSAFPGTDESAREAQDHCGSHLQSMLHTSPMADRLTTLYLYPNSLESWTEDKGVICMAADKGDNKLTGKVNP